MRFRLTRSGRRALITVVFVISASLPVLPVGVSPTGPVAGAEAASLSRQDGWDMQSIPELVEVVQILRGFERARELLGVQDPERTAGLASLEHELRARVFWDQVFPQLLQAEGDCAFGEAALLDALTWARQVEIAEPEGWEEEVDVINESMRKIVLNCHDQIYKLCVLEDRELWAQALEQLNRNLELLGYKEQMHEDRRYKCFLGWGGTMTVVETLDAPQQTWPEQFADGQGTSWFSASGSYELRIERRLHQSTGDAKGTQRQVNGGSQPARRLEELGRPPCLFTSESERVDTGSGGGAARLSLITSESGETRIPFAGPPESRAEDDRSTRAESSCGAARGADPRHRDLPNGNRSGELVVQKDDPYAERLNGEVIDVFRQDQRGVFTALFKDSGAPWLGAVQAVQTPASYSGARTITVTIRYDLTFGG